MDARNFEFSDEPVACVWTPAPNGAFFYGCMEGLFKGALPPVCPNCGEMIHVEGDE